MYSAYKLNKHDDNIQSWCTPCPIWNQSVVPRLVLTVASWPTCRFLRRLVRWSGILISFRIFHSLLWSTQSEALALYSVTIPFLFSIHCFQNDESNNDVVKRKDNTGVDSLVLLQGIFPIQGSNPGLLYCRQILYCLSHQGSPRILAWVAYPFPRGSSRPRNWTRVSCIAGGFFTSWVVC